MLFSVFLTILDNAHRCRTTHYYQVGAFSCRKLGADKYDDGYGVLRCKARIDCKKSLCKETTNEESHDDVHNITLLLFI